MAAKAREPDGGVRDPVYRLVGSTVRSMLWDLLAAVVAGLLVTQLATAVTTVYLHRTLAHRALTMHPVAARPVPVRHLDHAPGCGPASGSPCTASTTPRPTPTEDPHSPLGRRVLAGPARQRRPLQAGRQRRGEHAEVRPRHPARPRSTSSPSTTRSSGSAIGIAHPRRRHVAPRLPAVGRVPRGRHPRRDVRDAVGRDQRDRAPPRQAALRELGDQRAAPRARDRRRGPAQQPPRRADVGALRAAARRDRSRAGGSCARSCSSASRASATTTSSSRPC